jgi:hypothetical protein
MNFFRSVSKYSNTCGEAGMPSARRQATRAVAAAPAGPTHQVEHRLALLLDVLDGQQPGERKAGAGAHAPRGPLQQGFGARRPRGLQRTARSGAIVPAPVHATPWRHGAVAGQRTPEAVDSRAQRAAPQRARARTAQRRCFPTASGAATPRAGRWTARPPPPSAVEKGRRRQSRVKTCARPMPASAAPGLRRRLPRRLPGAVKDPWQGWQRRAPRRRRCKAA